MEKFKEFFGSKLGKVLAVVLVVAVIFVASGILFSLGPQKVAAQVTTALDQVTAERDVLVQENGTMKAEIQTVTAQRDALQAQIDQLEVEKAKAGSDQAALQAQIDQLTVQLTETENQKMSLQGQLDVIAAEKAEAESAKLAAEAAAQEVFDIESIRSAEMAKLVPASTIYPYNPRGEDWMGGYVFALEPGQYQVLFTSEGTISVGESNYVITPVQWRENGVVIQNKTSQTLQFRLTGFAPSGFGQWPYRIGAVPDIDEILWSTVGHGENCGSGDSTGCHEAMLHELIYDGTGFNATTNLWDTPHDIVDNTKPIRTADWASVDLAAGWAVLMENLSQPAATMTVKTQDSVLYLGVTNGKDQVLWLPAGAVIVPPTGEPITVEKPSIVILQNRVGDTVVFKVSSIDSVKFMEFRKGADPAAAGQFIVNYTAASSDKAMFGASATPTSADAIGLLIVTNE